MLVRVADLDLLAHPTRFEIDLDQADPMRMPVGLS